MKSPRALILAAVGALLVTAGAVIPVVRHTASLRTIYELDTRL